MKLGIMQPYAFPYLGYFQLIRSVDKFVLHDDAAFIKQGWVNRNRILGPGGSKLFTIPVRHISSNRRICDTRIAGERDWRGRLLRVIRGTYAKAPCFDAAWPLLEEIIRYPTDNLGEFIFYSLTALLDSLRIDTTIVPSARIYGNADQRGADRVIDICRREGAASYVNPEGGTELYSGARFRREGLRLEFLIHEPRPYAQFGGEFVPRLSIIDVLMFNRPEEIAGPLGACRLEEAGEG